MEHALGLEHTQDPNESMSYNPSTMPSSKTEQLLHNMGAPAGSQGQTEVNLSQPNSYSY